LGEIGSNAQFVNPMMILQFSSLQQSAKAFEAEMTGNCAFLHYKQTRRFGNMYETAILSLL
jgi:hypothetical protein